MVNKDTKMKLDSLDRRLNELRRKSIELKTDMKTLYSEARLSEMKRTTLESKYNTLVERILDVDSVWYKHTREVRQMLVEIQMETSFDNE